jgi:N-acetylglucosamine-6-phosphate deacetylase
MIVRVSNGRIATAREVLPAASISIEQGTITGIERSIAGPADSILDLDGGWLLPGFIDSQVNGGGGILFNDHPNVDAIATIGEAHARYGTTAFLPTLISDSPDRIAQALDAVDAAIAGGVPGVVGIHVEGPFINEAKRGIHDAHRLRRLDPDMLALLTSPRQGKVLVTLAPELCDEADIQTLVRHGVIVSAGHTDVTYEAAQAAIAAGLTGFTHLFNAMSPLHHREPGAVGAALDSDCYCGIIVDGVHLHPAAVRIATRVKGPERLMLVTDAMPSVGTDDDEFMLQGKRILVRDGICIFEDSTLAGAHLDMATAVRNMVAITELPIPEVAMMASATPASFLALQTSRGSIAAGMRADWAWLGADLQPRGTWIGGVHVAEAAPALAPAEG